MTAAPLISVIDDDESLRMALVGLLRSFGYVARGFASAEEFLASAAISNFACIITDIQMPGMSGIDLKRHLLADHCQLPVIMITARVDQAIEEEAVSGGAACFLRKPFEARMLIDCLEKTLVAKA